MTPRYTASVSLHTLRNRFLLPTRPRLPQTDFYPNVGMLALKPVLSVDKGTNTIKRATGKNIAKGQCVTNHML